MNKKGQMGMFLIGVFIVAIVGLVLFAAIGPFIGQTTNTATRVNETVALTSAGTFDLTGQEFIGSAVVINSSDDTVVPASNYTIAEAVSTTTGVKTVQITVIDGQHVGADGEIQVTYEYGADGYIDSAGGRSMAGLIPIFFALGIAVAVLMGSKIRELLANL